MPDYSRCAANKPYGNQCKCNGSEPTKTGCKCFSCGFQIHPECGEYVKDFDGAKFVLCPFCTKCASRDQGYFTHQHASPTHKCIRCKKNVHIPCSDSHPDDETKRICKMCQSQPQEELVQVLAVINNTAPTANKELIAIRESMTLEVSATFKRYHLENCQFVWWLWNNERDVIHPDLRQEVDEKWNGGNLTVPDDFVRKHSRLNADARKKKYFKTWFRNKVDKSLGVPGIEPPTDVIQLDNLTADIFVTYLLYRKKKGRGLLTGSSYKAMRSALTYLFERYDLEQDNYFFKNIGELIKGLTREAAKARQIWGSSI